MIQTRYSTVAIFLHWTIAALIIANLCLGWLMGFLHEQSEIEVFQWHKSIGITILLLSVLRLLWRLVRPPPGALSHQRPWERATATAVHWAFYAIMLALPLTGWIVVSTTSSREPMSLYFVGTLPYFPGVHDLARATRKALDEDFGLAHKVLAFNVAGLLVLHLGAIAKHEFLDRVAVLSRMLPSGKT